MEQTMNDKESKEIMVNEVKVNHETKTLPTDIIEEVLLRLPPKSIIKFQSVCKLFYRLSTSRSFITAHSCRLPTSFVVFSVLLPFNLMLIPGVPEETSKNCNRTKGTRILERITCLPLRIPETLMHPDCNLYLENTCDGFMCFIQLSSPRTPSFIIVNQLTNQCLSIPIPYDAKFCISVLGFYYHLHSNQYRLLVSNCLLDRTGGGQNIYRYSVLTLGPNTWRDLETSTPYGPSIFDRSNMVLLHNNLYGLGGNKGLCVVVFSLESEQFSYLSLPDNFEYSGSSSELLEIGGKLCLCNVHSIKGYPKLRVELWILEDYRRGIWVEKKVYLEKLRICTESLMESATGFVYSLQFLLVTTNNFDLTLPEEKFTFYYAEVDAIAKMNSMCRHEIDEIFVSVKKYRESLASIDIGTKIENGNATDEASTSLH